MTEEKLWHSNEDIGDLLRACGVKTSRPVIEFIKTITNEQGIYFASVSFANETARLLTRILHVLKHQNQKQNTASLPEHPIADGYLQWLHGHVKDRRIDTCDFSALSIRARNVLRHAGFVWISELTAETLLSRRNCGRKTAEEVLAWVSAMPRNARKDDQ